MSVSQPLHTNGSAMSHTHDSASTNANASTTTSATATIKRQKLATHGTTAPALFLRPDSQYDTQEPVLTPAELESKRQHFTQLRDLLQKHIHGPVFLRPTHCHTHTATDRRTAPSDTPSFHHSTTLLNSNGPLIAWLAVRPENVEDVQRTLAFCRTHALSPSVRSGGYSTAAWPIQGDVVLDMRAMNQMAMLPHPSQSQAARTEQTADSAQAEQKADAAQAEKTVVAGHTTNPPHPQPQPQPSSSSSSSSSSSPLGHTPLHGNRAADCDARKRVVLPATGGFVWTAGQQSTRPLQASDSIYAAAANATAPATVATIQQHTPLPHAHSAASHSPDGHPHPPPLCATHASAPPSGPTPAPVETYEESQASASACVPGIHTDMVRLVEFGPGVGVRELDVFTSSCTAGEPEPVAYHVPLSAFPVGSAAMTLGGVGYLSRAYGLSLDNVVEVDLVLADGRLVTLNEEAAQHGGAEMAELWWAVRGAGPCFGVVVRVVAKAYAVPRVYAGNLIYPFNPATAPSLLRHWRDCIKGCGGVQVPRTLYSNVILTAGPPDGLASPQDRRVIVVQTCFLGTSDADQLGARFVQALASWTGERMVFKDVSDKSFLSQQDGVAQVLKSSPGNRWMVRGDLLGTLTDDVIAQTIDQFAGMGGRAVWLFELVGGAIAEGNRSARGGAPGDKGDKGDTESAAARTATCVGDEPRQAQFTAAALQQWTDDEEDVRCARGVETWVERILKPCSLGGPYACFLERGESLARCQASFGAQNLQRLLDLKRRVDPHNVFRHTFGQGLQAFLASDAAAPDHSMVST